MKPEKGSIQVDGTDLKKLKSPVLGYVPQYTLFDPKFPITVFETVLSGRIRKGIFLYSDEDRKAASDILDNIGLSEVKNNTFSALSGGQRQRVMIARALAGEPEILLLDEPTTNIDSTTEDYLSSLITELNKDLTIVLVTHDTGFITDFNSRIFCVNKYFHEHPTEKVAIGGGTMKMVRHDIDIHSDIHSGGNI